MKGLTEALKGISGDYELNRLVGFFGGIAYVIGAHIFVGYEVLWLGKPFDLTAYCLAFPGGLAVVAGGTAAAISIKDRNVASAKVTEQTGTIPAPPPAGPRTPIGDPPPVDQPAEALPEYAR